MDVINQSIIATATLIASISTEVTNATNTLNASGTTAVKEVSPWFSYIIDILLIAIFLFLWFFVKPEKNPEENLTEEEKPNPLEQVLRTDPVEEEEKETTAEEKKEETNNEN